MNKVLLRQKVCEAVSDAVKNGPEFSKATIVNRFLGKGASRATLYHWVDAHLMEVAADMATDTPAPSKSESIRKTVVTLAMRGADALAADKPDSEAIPFLQRIQDNLHRLDAVMAMAYKEDVLKNPKLVLDTVEAIGRTLTRAARIQVVIEDRQRQEAFMEGLTDIILQEEPRVRDRIVGKLQNLRLSYGSVSLAPRG